MKKFSMLCLILILAMVMAGTANANYLQNPGFEISNSDPNNPNEPNDWNFLGGDSTAIPTGGAGYEITYVHDAFAHLGDDYVKLEVTSYSWAVVYQEFDIAEGIDYTLKAWAKIVSGGTNKEIGLELEFKDSGGNWIRRGDDITVFEATGSWALYVNDSNGVAPIGTRTVACTVSVENTAGAGGGLGLIAYFDDLELTSTPDFAALDDCQKTQFLDGFNFLQGDLTRDCLVDLRDIAVFANHWTECNIDSEFGGC